MNSQRCFGPDSTANAAVPGKEVPCPRSALRLGPQGPRHLAAHLTRLQTGALFLGHPCDWLEAAGQDLARWLHSENLKQESALRLRLYPECGLLVAEIGLLPQLVQPYRLVPMAHPLAARRRAPETQHKGLCGPWSARVLALANQQQGQDALLCWPDGTVAETAIAAIGLEIDGAFLLPSPEGRVASLAESLDLPAWAADRDLPVRQEAISLGRIKEGQLWCMNALRGIWPATVE